MLNFIKSKLDTNALHLTDRALMAAYDIYSDMANPFCAKKNMGNLLYQILRQPSLDTKFLKYLDEFLTDIYEIKRDRYECKDLKDKFDLICGDTPTPIEVRKPNKKITIELEEDISSEIDDDFTESDTDEEVTGLTNIDSSDSSDESIDVVI